VTSWRHGIASRHLARASLSGSCADTIVDAALEEGSDLIVSGAYGHTRMREWVFGALRAIFSPIRQYPA
jgi:nucleotide-binding universal stress UspA family protein